jgi:hypothetical protein
MLRGVLLLAGISAALTGLLFAATGGRLTDGTTPVAAPSPAAVLSPAPSPTAPRVASQPAPSSASVAGSADPAPATGSAEPPMGGPLVPLPNPLPVQAPEPARAAPAAPTSEAMASPVAPPAPALPAETTPDLRSTTPAPAPAEVQAALPAPVPKVKPRTLPAGTNVIFDQPKAAGGTKLWTGCTKFKSYDPASETYRGLDGQLHSCKAN